MENRGERDQAGVVISSGMTGFYKRAFPAIWFGILAIFLAGGWASSVADQVPLFFVMPCIMALFGFFLFKKLLWVLADEVRDCGSYLVVRNRNQEVTVDLSNIMNVSATTNMNPPHVTLRLVQPCRLGTEIVFSPLRGPFSLNPFRKNEVVEDLIARVDQARRTHAR